jgi:hypothetical protein
MYNIIYNNTSHLTSTPAQNPTHQYHPPAQNINQNQILIKLHHSRHPSDNLCGVRIVGRKIGKDWIEYK